MVGGASAAKLNTHLQQTDFSALIFGDEEINQSDLILEIVMLCVMGATRFGREISREIICSLKRSNLAKLNTKH